MLKLATIAEHYGVEIMPHVTTGGLFGINLAATLQAMATVSNCSMVEYCFDPPLINSDTQQAMIKRPIWVDAEGCVEVPKLPGLGFELNEDWLAANS